MKSHSSHQNTLHRGGKHSTGDQFPKLTLESLGNLADNLANQHAHLAEKTPQVSGARFLSLSLHFFKHPEKFSFLAPSAWLRTSFHLDFYTIFSTISHFWHNSLICTDALEEDFIRKMPPPRVFITSRHDFQLWTDSKSGCETPPCWTWHQMWQLYTNFKMTVCTLSKQNSLQAPFGLLQSIVTFYTNFSQNRNENSLLIIFPHFKQK